MTRLTRYGTLLASLLVSTSCTTEEIRPQAHKDASTNDSSTSPPLTCSADVPDACPNVAPSYTASVVPILDEKCNGCHTGGEGPWPLTNHDDVVHWRTQVLTEVARCTMPPPLSGTRLSEAERTTIIDWLVCGAPEN